MQTYQLTEDIRVYTIAAASFPEGVKTAHEKLHALIPFSPERKYFGISRMNETGGISYWAAAEERVPGELAGHGLPEFIIQSGSFRYIDIPDFMQQLPAIGKAFEQLLKDPALDPQGYCLEWYRSMQECRCMVPLLQN